MSLFSAHAFLFSEYSPWFAEYNTVYYHGLWDSIAETWIPRRKDGQPNINLRYRQAIPLVCHSDCKNILWLDAQKSRIVENSSSFFSSSLSWLPHCHQACRQFQLWAKHQSALILQWTAVQGHQVPWGFFFGGGRQLYLLFIICRLIKMLKRYFFSSSLRTNPWSDTFEASADYFKSRGKNSWSLHILAAVAWKSYCFLLPRCFEVIRFFLVTSPQVFSLTLWASYSKSLLINS